MIEPLEVEAQHAARPWISNVFAFLQPMPNRVASNVPTLPLRELQHRHERIVDGRSGTKVRAARRLR